MSKKIAGYENYRIVIEPRRIGDFGSISVSDRFICPDKDRLQREYKARCEEIVSDIKRHVSNVGSVDIECDEIEVCGHCGSVWTENSKDYNGGCCDADQNDYENRSANT